MIEALIGIALGVLAFLGLPSKNAPPPAASEDAPQAPPALRYRLNIAESLPYSGSVDFVQSFGIPAQQVREVRMFKGPATEQSLPFTIRDCLQKSYASGDVRGPEVAGLIGAKRELMQDEAVYFALVETGPSKVYLVGFVDRIRGE